MTPVCDQEVIDRSASYVGGFTITELLVAMTIVGLVLGSIYGVFVSSNRSYHKQERVADAQQGARVAMGFMVRDIRMTGLDPKSTAYVDSTYASSNAPAPLIGNANQLQLTADLNLNGVIDDVGEEEITYRLNSGVLERVLGSGTTQSLLEGVSDLTFTYTSAPVDSAGVPLDADRVANTVTAIRSIQISLTVEGSDAQGDVFNRTLTSEIRCRNL